MTSARRALPILPTDRPPEQPARLVHDFTPALIDAQKTYARALLTHQNPYTKNAYTDEPAVAMIEITNEDTFFIWGGQKNLDTLPEPFARELRAQPVCVPMSKKRYVPIWRPTAAKIA